MKNAAYLREHTNTLINNLHMQSFSYLHHLLVFPNNTLTFRPLRLTAYIIIIEMCKGDCIQQKLIPLHFPQAPSHCQHDVYCCFVVLQFSTLIHWEKNNNHVVKKKEKKESFLNPLHQRLPPSLPFPDPIISESLPVLTTMHPSG